MLIVPAYLFVGIDAMKGMSRRVDCSSEEDDAMLSPTENDLSIVKEGEIEDGEVEEHVENPLPSI